MPKPVGLPTFRLLLSLFLRFPLCMYMLDVPKIDSPNSIFAVFVW